MSLMREYIDKKLSSTDLEAELLKLITAYNKLRGTYLFVYFAAIEKQIPALSLDQSDFYIFHDFLRNKDHIKNVDIYVETPGGRGETAEEIVRFLHNNFETVSFIVSGEAKSAGTLMVLSGDEILMTETGSLGPIDAQMKIGRSVVSAYDYIEWVEQKRKESEKQGSLNPFDATMVAQITPGELGNVFHALKFAEDLVIEWLIKYKFKKWTITETHKKPVTEDMKRKRASEIASGLTNHSKWRLHGRSIKINDLENLGLKITPVDNHKDLADLVYRIQTICRLLCDSSTVFKIYATKDSKIFKHASPASLPMKKPEMEIPGAVLIEQKCPKCNTIHKIYAKLITDQNIDNDLKKQGYMSFPKNTKITCKCGHEIDLLGLKNKIEMETGRKIIVN